MVRNVNGIDRMRYSKITSFLDENIEYSITTAWKHYVSYNDYNIEIKRIPIKITGGCLVGVIILGDNNKISNIIIKDNAIFSYSEDIQGRINEKFVNTVYEFDKDEDNYSLLKGRSLL